MKSKFKLLITISVVFFMLFSSFCFATDSNNNDIMLISNEDESYQTQQTDIRDSDLYIGNQSEYEIKNIINGNVFATVDTLNIDSTDNGGIIEGNLFATSDNVNIKSNITYSDTEKDDIGNPVITINKSSAISGNVFLTANKFVLEPGCEINGDLYICANEVYLEQNSKINGNVFILANKLNLNAEIGGNLYANVKYFDMQYFRIYI